MAKVGRKKIQFNLKEIEGLAARGLTHEQISEALGIVPSTLYKHKAEYAEFSEAIRSGQAKGIAKVASALFDNAVGGNFSAQSMYLKCRAGWREQDAVDQAKADEDKKSLVEQFVELAKAVKV